MSRDNLVRAISAYDAVSGATTSVMDADGLCHAGSKLADIDPSDLDLPEETSWSGHGQTELLSTPLPGTAPSKRWLVSQFGLVPDEQREAWTVMHRAVASLFEADALRRDFDETRHMLQAVLNTIPVRVFWKDRNGVYLGANQRFASDAGVADPTQLLGKTDYDVWPEQAELYRSDDAGVIQTGEPKVDYEEPQTGAEGQELWLQTSKIPLRTQAGEIFGVLGTYADITPRKTAEAEREALLHDLEGKNNELERYAYTVSHDLKAPLVTIRGFLGVLREDIEDVATSNPKLAESMLESEARIQRAAFRMGALLDDLLDMSRIGRVLNPKQNVSLRAIVDDVLLACAGRLDATSAEVEVDVGDLVVHVDPTRIAQVFQNLVENACKYRSPERALRIRISAAPGGLVQVSDNGIGIPQRHHTRIFRAFEKLDPSIEGSGIGLALVKRIIETHGGQITVHSLEEGTAFSFQLQRISQELS